MSRERAQRRAAVGVLLTTAVALALATGVPVAAAPGGNGNGGQGGHGTTTSSTSSTSTTTSSTLPPPSTSTTTTSLPPTSIPPDDTSSYHFCAGPVHCSLTSHGGTVTWSSGGLPGYQFVIWVDRPGVGVVASSSESTGSLDTLSGDYVYASASNCQYQWELGNCGEGSVGPSNYGYVLVVNP